MSMSIQFSRIPPPVRPSRHTDAWRTEKGKGSGRVGSGRVGVACFLQHGHDRCAYQVKRPQRGRWAERDSIPTWSRVLVSILTCPSSCYEGLHWHGIQKFQWPRLRNYYMFIITPASASLPLRKSPCTAFGNMTIAASRRRRSTWS